MSIPTEQLDWAKAEEYLQTCERVYGEIGGYGAFALVYVINPVRVRFNSGERTRELYDEIMEIEL